MKKLSLLLIALFTAICIHAQKLKIDDGIITIDKKPIAKLEGESGLFKGIDLTYKSLSGEFLFKVTMEGADYFIPTWEESYWYELTFAKPSVKVRYVAAGIHRNEKKISELFLIKVQPPLINGDAIDESALKEFVAQYDNSEAITKDSIAYMEYETALINQLSAIKIERDLKKPVSLKLRTSNAFGLSTTKTFDIIQDKKVIGYLEKYDETTSNQRKVVYQIFKNLNTPIKRGDKTISSGLALYCEMSSFPKNISYPGEISN